MFTVHHDGQTYASESRAGLISAGVPAAAAGGAVVAAGQTRARGMAQDWRDAIAPMSAAKAVAWEAKAAVAPDLAGADPTMRALFDREAGARGLTPEGFAAICIAQNGGFRAAALLCDVLEAEAVFGLAALDPAADDIEAQVAEALAAAEVGARAEVASALAAL